MWNKTCEKCAFRARRGTSGVPMYTCDYLYYADKMRGCEAGKGCTRFVKRTAEIDELVKKASKGRPGHENEGKGILAFLAKDFPNVPTPVTYERPKRREEKDELTEQQKAQIAAELAGEISTKEKEVRHRQYMNQREKNIERAKKWYAEHPGKKSEHMKKYRDKQKKERSEKNGVQQEQRTAPQDQDGRSATG